MPDLVYLSLCLREFDEQTMLAYWRQAVEEFPASAQTPGVWSLAVYPLNWTEAPVVEESFRDGISPEETLQLAEEFLHADCAYEAQMNWDLWTPKAGTPQAETPKVADVLGGWERKPQVVSIVCLGAEFDREGQEDPGHLEINFGPESNFLPAKQWALTPEEKRQMMAAPQMRENVEKLVDYARRLEKKLPVARRRFWCESGEDLAEQILSFWKIES